MSYTRTDPNTPLIREASIQSVDVVNHSAQAVTRFSSTNVDNINNPLNKVFVDTSYYVGATQVQPTPGEQWNIQKVNGQWRLHSRISFNDPNQQLHPTAGQHVIGSGNGPIELQGTGINANGPLRLAPTPTSAADPGSLTYNGSVPTFYNGTTWVGLSTGSGGGGGGSVTEIFGEVPVGLQDGSNVTFTLSHPFVTGSTCVYRNGLRAKLSTEYTESSPDLVFTTAPLSSDVIEVDYLEGTGSSTSVYGEIPSGTQDGSNVTFSLVHTFVTSSTCVYRNGVRERLSTGYTESSPDLVFTTAPLSSDVIEVDYLIL